MQPRIMNRLPREEVELFRRIKAAIRNMPDRTKMDLGRKPDGRKVELSTHILARGVAKVCRLRVFDCIFHEKNRHTCVMLPSGNLIDLQPVALGEDPVIVYMGNGSPWRALYRYRSPLDISDGRFGQTWFRRAVRRVDHYFYHSLPLPQ